MYKVIESWKDMTQDRFTEMFRWLIRSGHVASPGTLWAYQSAIKVTGTTYYALAKKVTHLMSMCGHRRCGWLAHAC